MSAFKSVANMLCKGLFLVQSLAQVVGLLLRGEQFAACVTAGTVVSDLRQTAVVCERDEAAAAARLAFAVCATQDAIATIQVAPHIAVRSRCAEVESFK